MSCSLLISVVALGTPLVQCPVPQQSQASSAESPELVQLNSVLQGFIQALSDSDWTRAIGYCSAKVQDAAKTYPSPGAFFRDVVPSEQLIAATKLPITAPRPKGGGTFSWKNYRYHLGCQVAELKPLPDDKWMLTEALSPRIWWRGSVQRTDVSWVVDFPPLPLHSLIEKESSELRQRWKKAIANETELEPMLKDVHTRLTPLAKQFRVGEPMLFRLELVNDGPAGLIYDSSVVGLFDAVTIKTSQGVPVPAATGPVQTGTRHELVKPGQTVILLDDWDLAKLCWPKTPGRYTVQSRGRVKVAEADPHKTIQISRGWNQVETVPAEGRRSLRRFPSNIVQIEVVATQPAYAPTK